MFIIHIKGDKMSFLRDSNVSHTCLYVRPNYLIPLHMYKSFEHDRFGFQKRIWTKEGGIILMVKCIDIHRKPLEMEIVRHS